MLTKKHRRPHHKYISSDSSVSSRDSSPSVSGNEPIILVLASRDYPPILTVPASPTMDQDSADTPRLSDLYLDSIISQAYPPSICHNKHGNSSLIFKMRAPADKKTQKMLYFIESFSYWLRVLFFLNLLESIPRKLD